MANLAMIPRAEKGPIIAVATEGDEQNQKPVGRRMSSIFRKTAEPVYPLLASIPLQIFAYYIAVARGCDVDKPRKPGQECDGGISIHGNERFLLW